MRDRTQTIAADDSRGFQNDLIPDGLQTSKQTNIPRLSLHDIDDEEVKVQVPSTTKNQRDNSGGSNGRKERLKNALNGGSDDSKEVQ